MKGVGENNPNRAYNTWAENQRIKETVRVAKSQGNAENLILNMQNSNSNRAYNTWEENQRIKESVKVAQKELSTDQGKEVNNWLEVIRLPETIRKFLLNHLKILAPLYDILILFLYYKLALYINEAFGYSDKISWLFNSPYKLTGNEIVGHLFYLGIFGLPMLYPIVIEIEFIIYFIKDIIRLFAKNSIIEEDEEIENHKEELIEETSEIRIDFKQKEDFKKAKEYKPKIEEELEGPLFKEDNSY